MSKKNKNKTSFAQILVAEKNNQKAPITALKINEYTINRLREVAAQDSKGVIRIDSKSIKKILILEDELDKAMWFQRTLGSFANVTRVKSADEAIDLMLDTKYDLIFLDHDLEGKTFVSSTEPNTGYHVALGMQHTVNKDTPVILHGHNPMGSTNMKEALMEQASIVPFMFFNEQIKII